MEQQTTEYDAILKAEELGCYWDGCDSGYDCECCGDRWYRNPDLIDLKTWRQKGCPASVHNGIYPDKGKVVCDLW